MRWVNHLCEHSGSVLIVTGTSLVVCALARCESYKVRILWKADYGVAFIWNILYFIFKYIQFLSVFENHLCTDKKKNAFINKIFTPEIDELLDEVEALSLSENSTNCDYLFHCKSKNKIITIIKQII